MEYKEFITELQKKLEEKKQELCYSEIAFFEDGFTSADAKELSIIDRKSTRLNSSHI